MMLVEGRKVVCRVNESKMSLYQFTKYTLNSMSCHFMLGFTVNRDRDSLKIWCRRVHEGKLVKGSFHRSDRDLMVPVVVELLPVGAETEKASTWLRKAYSFPSTIRGLKEMVEFLTIRLNRQP